MTAMQLCCWSKCPMFITSNYTAPLKVSKIARQYFISEILAHVMKNFGGRHVNNMQCHDARYVTQPACEVTLCPMPHHPGWGPLSLKRLLFMLTWQKQGWNRVDMHVGVLNTCCNLTAASCTNAAATELCNLEVTLLLAATHSECSCQLTRGVSCCIPFVKIAACREHLQAT